MISGARSNSLGSLCYEGVSERPGRRCGLALVNEAEAASGRTEFQPVSVGARTCPRSCPVRALHRHARDFAEDLDRWRSNRPLAFASEPFWRHTLPSWIRRRKRFLLVAAAASSLVLGLPTTTLMILEARRTQEDFARYQAEPALG